VGIRIERKMLHSHPDSLSGIYLRSNGRCDMAKLPEYCEYHEKEHLLHQCIYQSLEQKTPPHKTGNDYRSGAPSGNLGIVLLGGGFLVVAGISGYVDHLFPDLPIWMCWSIGVIVPTAAVILIVVLMRSLVQRIG
jgi:hypothetical protein